MKSNNDPDNLPANLGYDDVPLDDSFVRHMARVERHGCRRRFVAGVACSFAGLIASVLLIVLPATAMHQAPISEFNILASLVLVGLCGMTWIATEDATVSA